LKNDEKLQSKSIDFASKIFYASRAKYAMETWQGPLKYPVVAPFEKNAN